MICTRKESDAGSLSSSVIYISSDVQHVVVDGHMVFVLPFNFGMFFFVSPIDILSFTGGNRCQFPSDGRGVRSPAFIHSVQIQVVCLIRRSGRLKPISFRQMIHREKMRIHDISDGNPGRKQNSQNGKQNFSARRLPLLF